MHRILVGSEVPTCLPTYLPTCRRERAHSLNFVGLVGEEMFDFLLNPQEGINYEFIFKVYLVCVLLLFVLFTLERTGLMVIAKGLYIVFAPFTISTIWAMYMK